MRLEHCKVNKNKTTQYTGPAICVIREWKLDHYSKRRKNNNNSSEDEINKKNSRKHVDRL